MKLAKIITLTVCTLLFGLSQAMAGDLANTECPLKGKKVSKDSKTVEVEVAFCCPKCPKTFNKDVLAGLQKFAKADEGKCPFSGKAVDASAKVTVTVGVCCGGCQKKLKADPKKHLANVK